MSRTARHTPYDRWNIRATHIRPAYWWRRNERLIADGLAEEEEILGNVVYDLRYYAGCKRTPQKLAHRTPDWGGWPYSWGHGGWRSWHEWANLLEGKIRAAAHGYTREAAKVHRAGGDVDELPEPDGRTRHSARYEAW